MFEDNKYLRFACVIQCQKKDYSNNLRERLENLSLLFPCKYYSIVHDKDILESGELKGLHNTYITNIKIFALELFFFFFKKNIIINKIIISIIFKL